MSATRHVRDDRSDGGDGATARGRRRANGRGTGGAMAGGYNVFAKDIWSEGTRYPLLKIVEAGRERRDVVLTMRANNRLDGFVGDLRAQVGAARLGVERLAEIARHHGADTLR